MSAEGDDAPHARPPGPAASGMDGRAREAGRVYQASGDQHISEHHHHGPEDPAPAAGPDSVRRAAVGRTPVVLRDRTEVLDRLRAGVAPDRGGEVYVLHGMGGCGKTAVAYTLFQSALTTPDRLGLWVNAADRASLRAGMLAVAADRGAGEGELLAARNGYRPAADLVWERLDRSPEPWLLVLDNADDPSILRDGSWLRSSPRGTVVVTTRRSAVRWWPGADLQHIGVLPREDAARVLCDLAPHSGTLEEAAEVADRLGRLPLALTLAGGFLSHQVIDPWTMDTYGRRLEDGERVQLLDQGADDLSDNDPRHTVGRTWQLTLDAFEARGLPEAAALLRLLARLAPEPLPLSVLNHAEIGAVLPRGRAETALRALLDHSLAQLSDLGSRCVHSHGVLLDSVAATTPAAEIAELNATAARLLGAAVPAVPDAGPYDPGLRLLAPHTLALLRRVTEPGSAADAARTTQVADVLEVATRLAVALHRTGDYLSGWETVRVAAELAERTLGADHRAVLAARTRVGRALFRLGRYTEAEALLTGVHAVQQRLFGPADPDTLDSAHALQLVLGNLGPARREEAMTLLRSAVAGREAALGAWHPLTLRARISLLSLLTPAELLAADDSALLLALPARCAEHLGADHTVTVGALHNHAWALYALGRFEASDDEIRLATDAYLRRFGPDHPAVLSARQLRARTQAALGRLDSGIALMAEVVTRREQSLGAAHPFTANSRELLAELRSGRWRPPQPPG